MKDPVDVVGRIRELLVEELDRRIKEAAKRIPRYCNHNHRHFLDARRDIYGEPNENYNRIDSQGQTIGLCMLGSENPEQWNGTICEDDLDAQRCPYFSPIVSKESLWGDFQRDVSDPEWVASHLPVVRELLWVCEQETCPQIPWWKRIWYRWFLKITVPPPLIASLSLIPSEVAPKSVTQ